MDTSHTWPHTWTRFWRDAKGTSSSARPILSPSVNVLKQSALFAAISSISISRRLSRSTPWATIYVVVRGCFDGGQPEVNLRFTRQYPPLTSTSSSTPQSCDEGGRREGWYRGPRKGNEERKEGEKGRALSKLVALWASAHNSHQ